MQGPLDALLRVLAALRRRWPVVLATAALAMVGCTIAIFSLQPIWRASATIELKHTGSQVLDKVRGVDPEEDRLGADVYARYYGTQKAIIHSRTVVATALDGLGLVDDPEFLGVDGIRDEAERRRAAADVDPVERLRDLLTVGEVRNSRIVKISAEYGDPEVARDIANSVTHAYINHVNGQRTDTGARAKQNLEKELSDARERLQKNEQALEAFKREHNITSISLADRQNLITQNILTLSTKTKTAQAERVALESTYTEARRLYREGKLISAALLPASERVAFDELVSEQLLAEREFAQIQVKYGEKHPDHKRAKTRLDLADKRLAKMQDDLLSLLKARVNAARATEKQLDAALEEEKARALAFGRLEPRYLELDRDATNAEKTYALLSRRDAEIDLTNRVESPPVEILDLATKPQLPVRPRKVLLLGVSLVGGLMLGMLMAVIVDARDERVRSAADLERALMGTGLPVLGQLPALPLDASLGLGNTRAQRRQRDLYTHLHPQSLMAERCRALRVQVAHQADNADPLVLLVSSPSPGDGKSSLAINVALSFCQLRKRVLLLDADLRRPRLHHAFPPPAGCEDVGFVDLLKRDATLDDAVRGSLEGAPSQLSVLTCGAPPDNPAQLLDDESVVRTLVDELRARFDVVVIDSPPVLLFSDALSLATHVDGVCLLARCNSTRRSEIQATVALLGQGYTNVLGVVLNEVAPEQLKRRDSKYEYYAYAQPPVGSTST
ncbi:MAG: polysaccharide biosynthesis tyrosine autokinase [Myxococcales bacterium]|nr:polysaccharide biosynthesis tyrosine autokinase [Myxococcales bacterium]MCB9753280.1 polysaccharide biosynthesis tyrosine autokinase [Myxococcales bacterium]